MEEIKLNLKLIEIDINKIIPYENNNKEHTEQQIEEIAYSIQKLGFKDPIGINEEYEIVEGHGRYLAAKKLGLTKVPCIILIGMNEAEERLYRILHNKQCLDTEMNKEITAFELNAIKLEGIKIEEFGLNLDDFEVPVINALDSITKDNFSSLADEMKEESEIFSISFNFPSDKREKIETLIKEKGKDYFVNIILNELEEE